MAPLKQERNSTVQSLTSSFIRRYPSQADVVVEPDDAEVVPVLVGGNRRQRVGVAVRRLLQRDDLSLFRFLLGRNRKRGSLVLTQSFKTFLYASLTQKPPRRWPGACTIKNYGLVLYELSIKLFVQAHKSD